MWPKGIENLAVFSAQEVKRVAAKKRKQKQMSISLREESRSRSKKQRNLNKLSKN